MCVIWYTFVSTTHKELDGPTVKQRWWVIGWVTKNLISRVPPFFGRHVKLLVLRLQSLALTNPHWGSVVGYGPISLSLATRKTYAPADRTLIGWWCITKDVSIASQIFLWDTNISQYLLLPTLIPLSGVGTTCFHHVVTKIWQLFLRPAACLTSTLLETGTSVNDCKRSQDQRFNVPSEARRSSR
jgi:hypothetical protein